MGIGLLLPECYGTTDNVAVSNKAPLKTSGIEEQRMDLVNLF